MKAAITVLLLALSLAGCTKNTVVNTPPGVTSGQVASWTNAAANLQTAQESTHAVLATVLALNKTVPPVIPDGPGYVRALTGIGHAEQIEIEAAQFLKTVPNDWSQPVSTKISDYTTQILAQLEAANASGVLGVKDPSTGIAITETVLNVMRLVNLVQSLAHPAAALPRQPQQEVAFAR